MALALRFELPIAAGVKRILGDGEAQGSPQKQVGRPVVPRHEATEGHGESRTVAQHSRPGFGIFVCKHRGHGPAEHGMSAKERSIHRVVLKKVAVTSAFFRALPARDELHSGYRSGMC